MKSIQHSKFTNQQVHALDAIRYSIHKRGALLLELLVAISIIAIILSVGTESVFVSMQSGKTSSESDVAIGLANETLEAVRAVSDEGWQSIYDLTNGEQYHTVQSGTKWAVSSASEQVVLNAVNYTRYFVVENVNRCNDSSRAIASSTACTPADNYSDDPSTQKVTVTVSWQGAGSPVVVRDYFLRWRNVTCVQSSWTTSGSGDTVRSCGTGFYDTADSPAINLSSNTIELQ